MMYILKSLERDVLSYFLVFLRLWREGIWWQVFKNPRGHTKLKNDVPKIFDLIKNLL